MENTPVTITIDRWTASFLAAIALGFVSVGGVFLATFDASNVYLSVRWTTIAAGVYSVFVTLYAFRSPVRLWPGLLALIFVSWSFLGAFISTEVMPSHSIQQAQGLRIVLSKVSRSVLVGALSDSLLPVLQSFHESNDRRTTSIGAAFLTRYPSALVRVDMKQKKPAWDHTCIIPTEISDSAIELVGYDKIVRGWDPGFIGLSGDTGFVQLRVRLTGKGIVYAYEN